MNIPFENLLHSLPKTGGYATFTLETAQGCFDYNPVTCKFSKSIPCGTYNDHSLTGSIDLTKTESSEIEETIEKNQFVLSVISKLYPKRRVLFSGITGRRDIPI